MLMVVVVETNLSFFSKKKLMLLTNVRHIDIYDNNNKTDWKNLSVKNFHFSLHRCWHWFIVVVVLVVVLVVVCGGSITKKKDYTNTFNSKKKKNFFCLFFPPFLWRQSAIKTCIRAYRYEKDKYKKKLIIFYLTCRSISYIDTMIMMNDEDRWWN